jgi:4-amino-4-deoxy-L-arabinose transferase-like glycosyltransferase
MNLKNLRSLVSIRWLPALAASLFFVVINLAFLHQVGIQTDEALFSHGIYDTSDLPPGFSIFHHHLPIMLMSYIGALKSWLYMPIFAVWKPSPTSVRLPVILAGALTIWLFSILLRRLFGGRAAVIGLALLCTDTSFLLTTCFDWGPVVLQHLLAVSAILCIVCFHQEDKLRFLAAGFFLFGLGLWDKALFAWLLAGMALAAVLFLPNQLRKHLTLTNLAVSSLAFGLGAFPLIRYNVNHKLETFRANAAWNADEIGIKTRVLTTTFSGSVLFGYLVRDDGDGPPRQPAKPIDWLSVHLSEVTGHPENGFLFYAFLASLALTIWLWFTPARKPVLFFLTAGVLAWLQMLFGKGVGGSAHHAILIWPLPAIIIAIALAEASRHLGRAGVPLIAAAVLIIAGRDLLVTNEYLARLVRNGPGEAWTDAIAPLSDLLSRVKASVIYLDDWGMFENLRLLDQGALPLRVGNDPLSKPELDADDKQEVLRRLGEANAVFVGHRDGAEMFAGVNAKLRAIAAEAGYRQETVAKIADRNGRIIFEVLRFVRVESSAGRT